MSEWTLLWLGWIALFFLIEMPAVFNKERGDTLSEHLWKWFAVKDDRSTPWTWTRRGILGLALAWLVAHLLSGGAV